jgi:hypothetical protein
MSLNDFDKSKVEPIGGFRQVNGRNNFLIRKAILRRILLARPRLCDWIALGQWFGQWDIASLNLFLNTNPFEDNWDREEK